MAAKNSNMVGNVIAGAGVLAAVVVMVKYGPAALKSLKAAGSAAGTAAKPGAVNPLLPKAALPTLGSQTKPSGSASGSAAAPGAAGASKSAGGSSGFGTALYGRSSANNYDNGDSLFNFSAINDLANYQIGVGEAPALWDFGTWFQDADPGYQIPLDPITLWDFGTWYQDPGDSPNQLGLNSTSLWDFGDSYYDPGSADAGIDYSGLYQSDYSLDYGASYEGSDPGAGYAQYADNGGGDMAMAY